MPIDTPIIIICSIVLILGIGSIGLAFIVALFRYIKRLYYVKNFKDYISVLEYHMDKAYDIIHKDRVLAYSLEAYRVPDEEYETITQDFVRAVQKYIGPTLLKEFVQLYGSEDAFIFTVLDFFSRRYEDDEIRKTSLDNLTQEE